MRQWISPRSVPCRWHRSGANIAAGVRSLSTQAEPAQRRSRRPNPLYPSLIRVARARDRRAPNRAHARTPTPPPPRTLRGPRWPRWFETMAVVKQLDPQRASGSRRAPLPGRYAARRSDRLQDEGPALRPERRSTPKSRTESRRDHKVTRQTRSGGGGGRRRSHSITRSPIASRAHARIVLQN